MSQDPDFPTTALISGVQIFIDLVQGEHSQIGG